MPFRTFPIIDVIRRLVRALGCKGGGLTWLFKDTLRTSFDALSLIHSHWPDDMNLETPQDPPKE